MKTKQSIIQKEFTDKDKEVEHYRKVINKALSSNKGLVVIREGIEFSGLMKAIAKIEK